MSQAAPSSKVQINAVFEESTLHFQVPPETPLDELCTLLATYGRGHGELLLVEVACFASRETSVL
jgi:hypothetical protein